MDPVKSPSVSMLLEETRKYHIPLIGGSIPEFYNDRIYNTAMAMSPDSDVITKHRKMHLFDVNIPGGICFQESQTLTAGNSFTVYHCSLPKADLDIGIGVCYDMRFPELRLLIFASFSCLVLLIQRWDVKCLYIHLHLI